MKEDDFKGRSLARAKARRLGGAVPDETPAAKPAPPAAPAKTAPATKPNTSGGAHMVDIGAKPVTHREATAEGFLKLQARTLDALRMGTAPKGDPFPVARVAGILAAKDTPRLIPLCHPLPLTGIDVDLFSEAGGVRCRATVRVDGKTGVEMEALAAVTAALLTVWDMTKMLEKDEHGQYPSTAIENVRVIHKIKEAPR